jgi:hypothetical protein
MPFTWSQLWAAAYGPARILGSAVVVYLFGVVLLIALAQQRIVDGLTQANVGYDYSVAIQYYLGPESLEAQARRNEADRAEVRRSVAVRRLAQIRLQQQLEQSALALTQESYRAGGISGCFIPMVPAGRLDVAMMRNVANASLACSADASAGPETSARLPPLRAAATRFNAAAEEMESWGRDMEQGEARQRALEDSRTALASRAEDAARSQALMAILDIFKGSNLPLVRPLVYVPPPLMAIVLAFVSGMFGGLLTTLVLLVYPENRFTFTRSNSFLGRILLGGLIALGVVVLLFSGVAVLGENGGAAGDAQNTMAYAAIGLLAGMFSDQAAAWLSRMSRFSEDKKEAGRPATDDPDPATQV